MKTLTVRLPQKLISEIKGESKLCGISVSAVVRDRLRRAAAGRHAKSSGALEQIGDLIGSVDGLPSDLSARKKHYLRSTGYGTKRSGGQRISRRTAQPQ
jgi:hypothetical protein